MLHVLSFLAGHVGLWCPCCPLLPCMFWASVSMLVVTPCPQSVLCGWCPHLIVCFDLACVRYGGTSLFPGWGCPPCFQAGEEQEGVDVGGALVVALPLCR